ncbi:hypothetical protein [Acidipila sp. EB88]|uniref:hypothetical protein n=1 Tax=Acidipila sp. EB88 TaxID=2305226 RepID=UPI000F5FA035|nr:hypothetical protein [Acidipila sp. EB88]
MRTIASLALTAIACCIPALPLRAELHSQSKELIVMEPHDLPEQAQTPGNSFFLHADSAGNTYLYVEQQQGARLTVFDVTDSARIRVVTSTPLNVPGAFDFVRPLDGDAELIRFRDEKGVAVLDLHKAKLPSLHMVPALVDPGQTVSLGETGFLGVDEPYSYVRAVPRDFQVVDTSSPMSPALLTTVKQVKHRVVKDDTGTTFLLGIDGLTIIRRMSVENEHKTVLDEQRN